VKNSFFDYYKIKHNYTSATDEVGRSSLVILTMTDAVMRDNLPASLLLQLRLVICVSCEAKKRKDGKCMVWYWYTRLFPQLFVGTY